MRPSIRARATRFRSSVCTAGERWAVEPASTATTRPCAPWAGTEAAPAKTAWAHPPQDWWEGARPLLPNAGATAIRRRGCHPRTPLEYTDRKAFGKAYGPVTEVVLRLLDHADQRLRLRLFRRRRRLPLAMLTGKVDAAMPCTLPRSPVGPAHVSKTMMTWSRNCSCW